MLQKVGVAALLLIPFHDVVHKFVLFEIVTLVGWGGADETNVRRRESD